jgi:alpha-D-ribose 1-methylphosphonate 5-triphosphate diphosphatase
MGTYLANATVVLSDEVITDTTLRIEDGVIDNIGGWGNPFDAVVDVAGDILMPGMIDLHCDSLEKDIEPRRNVHFPIEFALHQNDQRSAMSGITTPFHAISFAGEELGIRNNEMAGDIVRSLVAARKEAMVDHRVHCRYEYAEPNGVNVVLRLINEEVVDLVSLMTHGPGIKQFRNEGAYEAYMVNNYGRTEEQVQEMIASKDSHRLTAPERCRQVAHACERHDILLASHDDDSAETAYEMAEFGVGLSEFPITLEAAFAARLLGAATMFGAPNILRGKSQSGSVRAMEAVERDVIDILCSDYHPGTLLPAVFKIPQETDWSLASAVRLVTLNPARATGLTDRGAIAAGLRADVLRVHMASDGPRVANAWVAGRQVLSCRPKARTQPKGRMGNPALQTEVMS